MAIANTWSILRIERAKVTGIVSLIEYRVAAADDENASLIPSEQVDACGAGPSAMDQGNTDGSPRQLQGHTST